MTATSAIGLEKQNGWDVGRDPRQMSREELIAAGHKPMSPLKALRLRCIDCYAGESSEVRRCTHLDCPAWPYRMGTNPWQAPRVRRCWRRAAGAGEKGPPGAKINSDGAARNRDAGPGRYHPTTRVIHGETAVPSDFQADGSRW